MRRAAKYAVSDEFRRGLFATRDIVESAPVRVANWRMIRILAVLACSFWVLAIVAIASARWLGGGYDTIFFSLGLPFAFGAFAFRAFDRLKIVRRPVSTKLRRSESHKIEARSN